MKKIYNKLVRDNIPFICEKNGQLVKTKNLDDKQYTEALHEKLKEEVQEYMLDYNIEELADIIEVVEAIAENKGSNLEKILEIKRAKRNKNGAFEKRIFLISVENQN